MRQNMNHQLVVTSLLLINIPGLLLTTIITYKTSWKQPTSSWKHSKLPSSRSWATQVTMAEHQQNAMISACHPWILAGVNRFQWLSNDFPTVNHLAWIMAGFSWLIWKIDDPHIVNPWNKLVDRCTMINQRRLASMFLLTSWGFLCPWKMDRFSMVQQLHQWLPSMSPDINDQGSQTIAEITSPAVLQNLRQLLEPLPEQH